MRHRGSQTRETREEAGYTFVAWTGPASDREAEAVLGDPNGRQEVWSRNDHYAGYVVEIDGTGYEFVRTLQPRDYIR